MNYLRYYAERLLWNRIMHQIPHFYFLCFRNLQYVANTMLNGKHLFIIVNEYKLIWLSYANIKPTVFHTGSCYAGLHCALTHWGRVTHICVGKLSIIGSDNGLSPNRCQAIILTNAGILFIGTLGTNFSEISIEIYTFSWKFIWKCRLEKWRPCCLGLNVLTITIMLLASIR